MSLVNSGISESCKFRKLTGPRSVIRLLKKHDRFKETDELVATSCDRAYHTFRGEQVCG